MPRYTVTSANAAAASEEATTSSAANELPWDAAAETYSNDVDKHLQLPTEGIEHPSHTQQADEVDADPDLTESQKYGLLSEAEAGDELIKCTQCSFAGPASAFPLRLNGTGHVRTCPKHTKPRRAAPRSTIAANETLAFPQLLDEVREQAKGKIDIDRFVQLDLDHPAVTGETLLIRANVIMDAIKTTSGYRFNYKRRQDSTQKEEKSTVFTYYCAQLEGEQTKHTLHPDESKRRPKKLPKIPRFHCNGWASITVSNSIPTTARVRLSHAFAHVAVFSKRAAGAGVGAASTLVPVHTTASLIAVAQVHGASEADPEHAMAVAIQAMHQAGPSGSVTGSDQVVSPSMSATSLSGDVTVALRSGRKASNRKRKEPPEDGVEGREGGAPMEPGSPHEVLRLISGADGEEYVANSSSPALSQMLHGPLGPLDQPTNVIFPPDYLAEIRRKVDIAFAHVEREGGMTIDEARAFEAAFIHISQLGTDIEMRMAAGVGIGDVGQPSDPTIDPELSSS